MLHRHFWAFLLPGIIVAMAYWSISNVDTLSKTVISLHQSIPYLIITPALALSLMFRLSREFNLLLILIIVLLIEKHFIWHNTFKLEYNQHILFHSIALLFPLNIVLHNFLAERGIFSLNELKRIAINLIQALALFAFILLDHDALNQYLLSSSFAKGSIKAIPISQVSLTLFTLGAVAIITRAILKPSVLNITQISIYFSGFFVLYFSNNELQASLFIGTTAFVILIGIILNSYHLAYIDDLTGLPSRRVLRHDLMALGKRYSIAMIDIDHFKRLNDTYGHDIGDQILRMVASRLRSSAGSSKIYRYGGEEFVILYPNNDINEATSKAIMICERVAVKPFIIRSPKRPRKRPELIQRQADLEDINVTVSIGVAEKSAQHAKPQDTLNDADRALYRAKDAGRNCVAV